MRIHHVVQRARHVEGLDGRAVAGEAARRLHRRHRARRCQRPGALEQRLHQGSERDVGIGVEAQRHAPVQRLDGAPQVHAPRRHAEIGIAHDDAQQQQRVGILDQRGNLRRAREAEIGAQERRVRVLEQPAPHEGGDDGDAEAARECGHLRLEAEAAHFHVHHEHGRAR